VPHCHAAATGVLTSTSSLPVCPYAASTRVSSPALPPWPCPHTRCLSGCSSPALPPWPCPRTQWLQSCTPHPFAHRPPKIKTHTASTLKHARMNACTHAIAIPQHLVRGQQLARGLVHQAQGGVQARRQHTVAVVRHSAAGHLRACACASQWALLTVGRRTRSAHTVACPMVRVGQIRMWQAQGTIFPVELAVFTACIQQKIRILPTLRMVARAATAVRHRAGGLLRAWALGTWLWLWARTTAHAAATQLVIRVRTRPAARPHLRWHMQVVRLLHNAPGSAARPRTCARCACQSGAPCRPRCRPRSPTPARPRPSRCPALASSSAGRQALGRPVLHTQLAPSCAA